MFSITSALALSAALLAGPALAQERWDGADDLDVNPLACEGGARRGGRQGL